MNSRCGGALESSCIYVRLFGLYGNVFQTGTGDVVSNVLCSLVGDHQFSTERVSEHFVLREHRLPLRAYDFAGVGKPR